MSNIFSIIKVHSQLGLGFLGGKKLNKNQTHKKMSSNGAPTHNS